MGAEDAKIVVIVNRQGNDVVPVVEQRPALERRPTDDGKGWDAS
jgi:hypothetical protein